MPLARRLLLVCLFVLSTFGLGHAATAPFLGTSRGGTAPTPEGRAPGAVIDGVGLSSNWTPIPPTLDGTIGGTEWANAQTYNISVSATPITLYLMNDAGYLYLAIDGLPDVTLDLQDSAVLLFDDEGGVAPLLGDGLWNAPTCPSTEGLFAYGNNLAAGQPADNVYLGIAAGGVTCVPFEVATGVTGAYSFASGHMVYEVRYDLAASNLHALPGQTFGAFIGCYQGSIGDYIGATSPSASLIDPSTYLPLTLATPPALAATNVIYGTLGNAGDLFMTVDPATGVATAIGPTGAGALPGLAVSPTGEIFATSNSNSAGPSNLYRIDATTGQATLVGATGASYMDAIAFDRDGNLWGFGHSGLSHFYQIDTSTGIATDLGAVNEKIVGLACDPISGTLYGSSTTGIAVVHDAIYTVDTSTGALTLVGKTGLGGPTPDIGFDVNGRLYGVKGGGGSGTPPANNLIAIDKTTGAGTVIGATGINGISGLGSQAFLGRAATNVIYGSLGRAGDQFMTVDPATGVATAIGPTGAGPLPGLAVSPTGEIFASSNSNGAGPSDLYRLDAVTGQAFLVGHTGVSFLESLAFDRNGTLWGAAGTPNTTLYQIDTATGTPTPVGPDNAPLAGLAFDPISGTLYGTSGAVSGAPNPDGIYRIDTATGAATLIGSTGLGGATPDLAFDVNGRLYGVKGGGGGAGGGGGGPNNLISIDKTTGAGTVIGVTGIDGISGMGSQAFLHRVAEHVIYGTQGKAGDLLVKIDPATGAGTPIGNTGVTGMPGLAISPAGDMYAVSGGVSPNDLYRIDPVTAQTFLVGNTGVQFFDSITFDNDGILYGVGVSGSKTLFKINPATAAVSAIGPTGEQLAGLAVDPTDGRLYASTGGVGPTNPSSIYRMNKTSGAIALIGNLGFATPNGAIPDITFDAAGQMYGVIGGGGGGASSDFIKIDKTSGAGVVIGAVGTTGVSGLDSWAYGAALDVPRASVPARGTFLEAARPNPFGAATELRFALAQSGPVKIEVFNVLGQRVTTLTNATFQAGEHFVRWSGLDSGGRPVSDGIYYVRMRTGDFTQSKAVVRIR